MNDFRTSASKLSLVGNDRPPNKVLFLKLASVGCHVLFVLYCLTCALSVLVEARVRLRLLLPCCFILTINF